MIPAPIFSGTFFVVLAISFLAAVAMLLWAVALALFPRARQSFRAHRGRSTAILAALGVTSSFFVLMCVISLRVELNTRKEEAAKHPVLEKREHLLGIDMPPGTRLSLFNAGDMKSIEKVEFPHVVDVHGIPAVAMNVGSEFDDEAPRNDQYPPSLTALRLTTTGPRTIDGWICGANEPLEIVLRNDARIRTLWLCHLADGNRVAGVAVPAGSRLMRSTTAYGDGLRDNDYWEIRVADGAVFELSSLPLRHPDVRLDRNRNILAFDYATLARAASVGDLTYPAGTDVRFGVRGLREHYPGAWLFKTARGQHAVSKIIGPLADGASVAQAPSGKVYAIFPPEAE
ncbi:MULTISPECIES: hypothetical protein [Burkholderia]|uniref:Uncharacterized protein n=2 Tax=Burkholderiaceae TaxID=119060 RepID=A0A7T6VKI4_9BURK|nr:MULTISPECIES: hypothetical protein [Burkholderia]QQK05604.1 hypothetical protein JFN94_16965 [Burkholderia anthina]